MRFGSWLLLLCLLSSLPAAAREGLGAPVLRRRTLVLSSRPGDVPPLLLHVAPGLATLVQLAAPLNRGTPRLPEGETRMELLPVGEDSWVLVPTSPLAEGEQVLLSLEGASGSEPLRFLLVSRRGEVDARVRVVPAPDSASDGDAAEALALQLLDAPEARPTLALPQEVMDLHPGRSRAQVDSVLWMGRRLFATVSVRGSGKGSRPWRLVQVRLRTVLADDSSWEWSARLVSGRVGVGRQFHVFTSLLPEEASRLELSLDGEDASGEFQPLPGSAGPVPP
ncbi:DUF2381 family protein [Archangium violaceum]|uniref:DUF2381 family protein n=1 Tax=Archangium violaceum TaxID=83451 RepID=UPI0019521F8F|nr:DUF2381 family protein [Archangium violaceum]QRN97510.1 DUF2381 family protein [Archangium violaceum]